MFLGTINKAYGRAWPELVIFERIMKKNPSKMSWRVARGVQGVPVSCAAQA